MDKKKKLKKLKIAGLTVLLASGMTFAGIKYSQNETDASLTVEQMENYIKVADEVLEDLNQTINSKETDPETRFEARQALKQVTKERENMQKKLDRAQKFRNKTIDFNVARGAR